MVKCKFAFGLVAVLASGVMAADYPTVEVSGLIARRSAVANDEDNKAVHLDGVASATSTDTTLSLSENDSTDDGFIELVQNNPGKSSNNSVAGSGKMYIKETTLALVNNSYEGTSIAVLDLDGDGPAPQDEDGDGNPDDANGDGVDDDDQVVPISLKVNERTNSKGPFLHGTFHDLLGKDGDGVDDNGSIAGVAATATGQPKIKGQVRTSPNGK